MVKELLIWLKTNFPTVLSVIGILCSFVSICQARSARRFANKAKTIVERDGIFKALEKAKSIICGNTELFRFINPNLNIGRNPKKHIVDKATELKNAFIELKAIIPATCSDSLAFNAVSPQDINSIYTKIISSSMIYDEQIRQLDIYFLALQDYLKVIQNKFMNDVIDLREKK